MIYILYGTIAFMCMFVFDVYTFKNEHIKKKVFGIAGVGLIIYASIMATIVSEKLDIPRWIQLASGVLCLGAAFLLIYSLFLELPFVNTYGKQQHNNSLVDTGAYALCRHPGVIWFGLLYLLYFFTTGAQLILICGIVWSCLDVLYVYLQEKYFFRKVFPEYEQYINTTPMLMPNKESINKCITTIFKRGDEIGNVRKTA